MLEGMIASTGGRIEELAATVKSSDGLKGIKKAKKEAMSYLWGRLTESPEVSFRPGSPAKAAYDRFEARLNQLVPG